VYQRPLYFLSVISLLAFILLPGNRLFAAEPEDASDEVVKVVYHADYADPRRFSAMLTSIFNMVNYYQNELIDYDIRIVFVAHGIRFLTDDKLEKTPFVSDTALEERRSNLHGRLSSLNNVQDVKLELCDITRTQIGLPKDKFYKGVDFVPSGVVRLVELQDQGFAYIKTE